MSCSAVAGFSTLSTSVFVDLQSLVTVAPNSFSAPRAHASPPACASPFTPAPNSPQMLPSSASSLASATTRPPGSPSACALPSPELSSVPASTALPMSVFLSPVTPPRGGCCLCLAPSLPNGLSLGDLAFCFFLQRFSAVPSRRGSS